jgi:hypothetical protein
MVKVEGEGEVEVAVEVEMFAAGNNNANPFRRPPQLTFRPAHTGEGNNLLLKEQVWFDFLVTLVLQYREVCWFAGNLVGSFDCLTYHVLRLPFKFLGVMLVQYNAAL